MTVAANSFPDCPSVGFGSKHHSCRIQCSPSPPRSLRSHHHPPAPDGEARFNVEFTFFGHVFEEVLLWEAPQRYVYRATGPDFPIKDYIAEIAVEMTGERSGQMIWSMYFDTIEGQEFKRILPIVLPAINEASLTKLALILGGELISCVHDFSGLEADV